MSLFKKNHFYELHVMPDTNQDTEQIAKTAKRYGYTAIAMTTDQKKTEPPHEQPTTTPLPLYHSVEIAIKNPSSIRREIRKWQNKSNCIILHGGNESVNRTGVETPTLDILSAPGKINHIIAKLAADNDVALEFDLGAIIHTKGTQRSEILTIYRDNLKLVRKYNTPYTLTTIPRTTYDFRNPREMAALAMLFGMTPTETIYSLSRIPKKILDHHNPDSITKGVKLI